MVDRVSFLKADGNVIEVHSVPVGSDPDNYARGIIARLRTINAELQNYSIMSAAAAANAKAETMVGDETVVTLTMSISKQLQHSTVRLECAKANGHISSGTGFHFRFKLDEKTWVPAVVTNKHVVAGAVECAIHLTLADDRGASLGRHERYVIKPFQWIDHPGAGIDLAVIPIQPLLAQLAAVNKRPFYIDLDESLIPSPTALANLVPLEEILMVGYPNGIWDSVNNLPIFRRGITATACNLNYQGRPEFLVDAAVFPGSSGSPVFIYNPGPYTDGGALVMSGRLLLVGVLYAVHLHTAQGEIRTVTVPTDTKSMAFSAVPNNLGICIQSARVLDFVGVFQELTKSQT